MLSLLWALLGTMRSLFRTRRELALENLALRQQVAVLIRTRGGRRARLGVWALRSAVSTPRIRSVPSGGSGSDGNATPLTSLAAAPTVDVSRLAGE